MKSDTFSNRLQKAMQKTGLKQIDISNKTGIDKTLINKYINGSSEAKQDNLTRLSLVLGVSEPWLMGYDVPIEDNSEEIKDYNTYDEVERLFNKAKPHLSPDDEETIKFIMNKTIKNYEESKNNKND